MHLTPTPIYVYPSVDQIVAVQNQVNSYYQAAFHTLIEFFGFGVGVVGILVPILSNWLQRQTFKDKFDFVEKLSNDTKKEMMDLFKTQLDEMKVEHAAEMKILKNNETRLEGITYTVQAIGMISGGRNSEGVLSHLHACYLFITANEIKLFAESIVRIELLLNAIPDVECEKNSLFSIDTILREIQKRSDEEQLTEYANRLIAIKVKLSANKQI